MNLKKKIEEIKNLVTGAFLGETAKYIKNVKYFEMIYIIQKNFYFFILILRNKMIEDYYILFYIYKQFDYIILFKTIFNTRYFNEII